MSAKVVELEAYRRKRTEAQTRAIVPQPWMTWATMPAWAAVIVWVPVWRMT